MGFAYAVLAVLVTLVHIWSSTAYRITMDKDLCYKRETKLNYVDYWKGHSMYLDRHQLHCGQAVMNGFQLQEHNNQVRYQYKCCLQGGKYRYSPLRSTRWDIEGGGQVWYLDRQNVDCGRNSVIVGFKLDRRKITSGRGWGRRTKWYWRYLYNCRPQKTNTCYKGYTDYKSDKRGKMQALAHLDAKCRKGFGLSAFRLQWHQGKGSIRYGYRCCKYEPVHKNGRTYRPKDETYNDEEKAPTTWTDVSSNDEETTWEDVSSYDEEKLPEASKEDERFDEEVGSPLMGKSDTYYEEEVGSPLMAKVNEEEYSNK